MSSSLPTVDSRAPENDPHVGAYDLWPDFPSPDLRQDSPRLSLTEINEVAIRTLHDQPESHPLDLQFTAVDFFVIKISIAAMKRTEEEHLQEPNEDNHLYTTLMQCFRLLSNNTTGITGKPGAAFAELCALAEWRRLRNVIEQRRRNDALVIYPLMYINAQGLFVDQNIQQLTGSIGYMSSEYVERYRRDFVQSYAYELFAIGKKDVLFPSALRTSQFTQSDRRRWCAIECLASNEDTPSDFTNMPSAQIVEFVTEGIFTAASNEFASLCDREFLQAMATWEYNVYMAIAATDVPQPRLSQHNYYTNIILLHEKALLMKTLMSRIVALYYNINNLHHLLKDINFPELLAKLPHSGPEAAYVRSIATNRAATQIALLQSGPALATRVQHGVVARLKARTTLEIQYFYTEMLYTLSQFVFLWASYEPLYIETVSFLPTINADYIQNHISLIQRVNAGANTRRNAIEIFRNQQLHSANPLIFTYLFNQNIRDNMLLGDTTLDIPRLNPEGLAARVVANITASMLRGSSLLSQHLSTPEYCNARAARSMALSRAMIFKCAKWIMEKSALPLLSNPPTRGLVVDPATFRITTTTDPHFRPQMSTVLQASDSFIGDLLSQNAAADDGQPAEAEAAAAAAAGHSMHLDQAVAAAAPAVVDPGPQHMLQSAFFDDDDQAQESNPFRPPPSRTSTRRSRARSRRRDTAEAQSPDAKRRKKSDDS